MYCSLASEILHCIYFTNFQVWLSVYIRIYVYIWLYIQMYMYTLHVHVCVQYSYKYTCIKILSSKLLHFKKKMCFLKNFVWACLRSYILHQWQSILSWVSTFTSQIASTPNLSYQCRHIDNLNFLPVKWKASWAYKDIKDYEACSEVHNKTRYLCN